MRAARTAFLILVMAVGSLASASQEQTSEQPVAEVLGKPIYRKDLAPPTGRYQQQPEATTLDEEQRLERDREQLRLHIWGSVFGDYAAARRTEATEEEVESFDLSMLARVKIEVEAKRESISKLNKEIARYQEELGDPEIPAERKTSIEANLDRATKSLDLSQRVLVALEESVARGTQDRLGRRASGGMVSNWKLNQALYQEYGGRIIFQQFGWEPIDAYRKLLDTYKDAGKFKILDSRFDGAAYSYFDHDFVYADDGMAEFYFEKPWWERTDQELISSGFKGP